MWPKRNISIEQFIALLIDRKRLFNQIIEIHCLLNGKTIDGQPANKLDFKIARYAIILLAATTLENFTGQTLMIGDSPFFNLYRLEKVAEYLRLEYDRTKQAKKMYEVLENKGEIRKEVTADKKTYISLTKKGERRCVEKLEELVDLRDYLIKLPPLQDKYTEEAENKSPRDLRSKSYMPTDVELKVEKLISRISAWD